MKEANEPKLYSVPEKKMEVMEKELSEKAEFYEYEGSWYFVLHEKTIGDIADALIENVFELDRWDILFPNNPRCFND